MISLQVEESTRRSLDRLMAALPERALRAGARALTRAATSGRTEMVRAVAQDLGVQQRHVAPFIKTRAASPMQLMSRVYAFGKRGVRLIDVGATGPEPSRGQGSGVRSKAAPGSFPHAFIATMPRGGHRGVFERDGRKRIPITELRTEPIPAVFRRRRAEGVARAVESLSTNLAHEVQFAITQHF